MLFRSTCTKRGIQIHFQMPENRASISVEELREAENEILKYVQNDHYREEIEQVVRNEQIRKSNGLRKLDPVMRDGLLCVGGRLRKAKNLDICTSPVILPKSHHVVTMIIRDYHEKAGHVGAEHVLALTREKYWVVHGRRAVQKVLNCCVPCRKKFASPGKAKMGDLPKERVTPG